ncbi:hypothetical protein FRC12_015420 [Ceratobasidium sp. 428]|nr:hypothetical protein FRC12_015420 [Ceratobasidium sp. 428]
MGGYFSKPPRTESKITGRVAIVTGGNRGIGLATAKQLYELGATVYIGSRSEANALKAVEQIRADVTGSEGQLKWFIVDMSSIKKAKEAAEAFLKMEDQLDILVHNAATAGDYELNEEGLESNMVTNHFAPFAFTQTVLDVMKRASSKPGSDVRIVNVSSSVHENADAFPIQFKDEAEVSTPFPATADYNTWSNMMARYGRSKLASVLYASELQRRFDADGISIITISLNPGAVGTDGAMFVISRIPVAGRFANILIGTFFATPDQGALTSMFAATNPVVRAEPEKYKGKYLMPVDKVTAPSKLAQDEELGKRLWDLSEKIVGSRITS